MKNKMNSDDFRLSKELILSPLKVLPEVDKFCMWMLAGAGATAALMISNLENLVNVMNEAVVTWLFSLLAISGLFGFLSKLCGIRAQTAFSVVKHVDDAVNGSQDANIEVALKEYFSIFPMWVKIVANLKIRRENKDQLFSYKIIARLAVYQSIWAVCQGLTFILFIVLAALIHK